MAADHRLSHIAPTAHLGWVSAVCTCGWKTPEYRNSGLAESLLDAHAEQERARDMWIAASMILLQTRDQRASTHRERLMLAEVMDRVRDSSRARQGLDPIVPGVRRVVAVDGDDAGRERLTGAVRQHRELLLVGEGTSYVDAVALTVVERPRLVIIGDTTEEFVAQRDIELIRNLSPDSRVCLYSDGRVSNEDADLVLEKSLPIDRLVAHLAVLAG